MMRNISLAAGAERLARWAAVALGFSIPVSVALDNILVVLLLACWLAGARYREKLALVRDNPVAMICCVLFLAYALASLYSVGDSKDLLHALDKAAVFLLVPILVSTLRDDSARHLALDAFAAAMLVTLFLSFLAWFGAMPENRLLKNGNFGPVVFKYHITHSLLMAFGAYLFAVKARCASQIGTRWTCALIAVLAAFNVLFMVQGRTGQLVLAALLCYLLFWSLRWRGVLIAAAVAGFIGGAAYLLPSSALHQRTALAAKEIAEWRAGEPSTTSIGQRLEFYRNSLKIVRENPLLGVGTGGFPEAYRRQVAGTAMAPTRNPHNEYLMMAVQLGLVGLGLLLYLFGSQWKLATNLPSRSDQALARGLVLAIAIASLVSSTLIDHTEGLFYVWASGVLFAGLNPRPA